MNDEEQSLLREFDGSQVVEAACRAVHGQSRHFAVPAAIKDAMAAGLLQILDGEGPVKDTPAIYGRMLMLTDDGRKAVGLPPVVADAPKTKKETQSSLFD